MGSTGYQARQYRWSPTGLFRFSALTFNGHKIHYNEDWTRLVESHPGLVVHGPLNLICSLDYWRDIHGHGRSPSEITYRALSPLYAGQTYQIQTGEVGDTEDVPKWEVLVKRGDVVCMRAEIKK
jgi:hydroxyacyl-ACP dehydratase HTD2-like protein with hotdog domain